MTNLQKIRKSRNMTQQQLADASGISLRMIQHYEQGDFNFSNIGIMVMIRLASALRCNLSDVLEGRDADIVRAFESQLK